MFVRWATRRSETGDSGVAAGFDAVPPLNIPTQVDPTLPLPRAGIHQNQILTSDPLLPDSGRSESKLIFGPCGGAPFPPGLGPRAHVVGPKGGRRAGGATKTAQNQAQKLQPLVCKGFASGLQALRKLFASEYVLRASCVLDT